MRNERQNDTIAAIATPPGEGGIAIVRISGARAGEFLRAAFRPAHRGEMKHGQMRYGTLTDPTGAPIDEVMAVFFRAPRSYTREDVAEIHLHGGTMCARAAMERLLSLGARAAEPGEFTYRAFMNGRVDLSEAEAVMGLIGARSQAARRASIRQLRGGVSAPIGRMREELTGLLAKIEAATDFPDEIDEDVTAKDVREGASRIRNELSRAADGRRARIVRDGASVVLCGRPNVGKSSLMNALLSADRAIVTDVPGTTRDVLTESLEIGGVRYQLSDTAGIRETADAIEKIGVTRARDALRDADCVLLVLDSSSPLTPSDQSMLANRDDRYITILNKSDLAPAAHSANPTAPGAASALPAFPANAPGAASAPHAFPANAPGTASAPHAFPANTPGAASALPAFPANAPGTASAPHAFPANTPGAASALPAFPAKAPATTSALPAFPANAPATASALPAFPANEPGAASVSAAFPANEPGATSATNARTANESGAASASAAFSANEPGATSATIARTANESGKASASAAFSANKPGATSVPIARTVNAPGATSASAAFPTNAPATAFASAAFPANEPGATSAPIANEPGVTSVPIARTANEFGKASASVAFPATAPVATSAPIARTANEPGMISASVACPMNTNAPVTASVHAAFPANESDTASASDACATNETDTTVATVPGTSSAKDTDTASASDACATNETDTTVATVPSVSSDKDTGTAVTSVSPVSSAKDTGTAVTSVSPESSAKDTGTAASSVSPVFLAKDTDTAAPSIPREPIRASAKTGEGIDEILRAIERVCRQSGASEDQMTLPRHIECAHHAMQALDRAIRSIESNLPLDLCATDLREALAHLGDITGETMNEHVIDRVFSDFCVGK